MVFYDVRLPRRLNVRRADLVFASAAPLGGRVAGLSARFSRPANPTVAIRAGRPVGRQAYISGRTQSPFSPPARRVARRKSAPSFRASRAPPPATPGILAQLVVRRKPAGLASVPPKCLVGDPPCSFGAMGRIARHQVGGHSWIRGAPVTRARHV